nr:YugN family protein [Virgibacillus doumboii]
MIPINSEMEGKIFSLYVLAELLKPQGIVSESTLDYENGFFDLQVFTGGDYYNLRLPFYAVTESLDYPGVTVRVEQPFILTQQYQNGYDEEKIGGYVDQAQLSGNINTEYMDVGKIIVKKVERLLFPGR